MLNNRQQEILQLLKEQSLLPSKEIQRVLNLTRARIHQLITPLINQGLVKKEGNARATIYSITDKRSKEQIIQENWKLRQKVKELERILEDRKIIERAKEILIAQFDIPPTEAYRKLQEQSMDSGRSMYEIAKSILAAYEL